MTIYDKLIAHFLGKSLLEIAEVFFLIFASVVRAVHIS